MQEQSNYGFGSLLPLTQKQAQKLSELHEKAIEVTPYCMNAPLIWDAENSEDEKYAKKFCLGITAKDETKIEPCPILLLCRETALLTHPVGGVWGGMSDLDRRKVKRGLR